MFEVRRPHGNVPAGPGLRAYEMSGRATRNRRLCTPVSGESPSCAPDFRCTTRSATSCALPRSPFRPVVHPFRPESCVVHPTSGAQRKRLQVVHSSSSAPRKFRICDRKTRSSNDVCPVDRNSSSVFAVAKIEVLRARPGRATRARTCAARGTLRTRGTICTRKTPHALGEESPAPTR